MNEIIIELATMCSECELLNKLNSVNTTLLSESTMSNVGSKIISVIKSIVKRAIGIIRKIFSFIFGGSGRGSSGGGGGGGGSSSSSNKLPDKFVFDVTKFSAEIQDMMKSVKFMRLNKDIDIDFFGSVLEIIELNVESVDIISSMFENGSDNLPQEKQTRVDKMNIRMEQLFKDIDTVVKGVDNKGVIEVGQVTNDNCVELMSKVVDSTESMYDAMKNNKYIPDEKKFSYSDKGFGNYVNLLAGYGIIGGNQDEYEYNIMYSDKYKRNITSATDNLTKSYDILFGKLDKSENNQEAIKMFKENADGMRALSSSMVSFVWLSQVYAKLLFDTNTKVYNSAIEVSKKSND
ncbi:MAG: hypothetical protein ACRC92_26735 [Peptostreptococcaceae bacterium]